MNPVPSSQQRWWQLLTRDHWFVFIVASLAWLFDCMDQQFFNLARDGAMEQLVSDKKLATVQGPYTTSVFLVGWAIGGLIFDGGIPPAVVMKYVARGGEVEPGATGFE